MTSLAHVALPGLTSSRTPSRSPARAHTDSHVHRSSSLAHPIEMNGYGGPSSSNANSAPPRTPPTSFPAQPQEPTINEEAAAVVSRSVTTSKSASQPQASSSRQPGKSRARMVGDWQLQKTLGQGSMGKVKLATNIYTKERVSCTVSFDRWLPIDLSAQSRSSHGIPSRRVERSLVQQRRRKSNVKKTSQRRLGPYAKPPSLSSCTTLTSAACASSSPTQTTTIWCASSSMEVRCSTISFHMAG